MEVVDLLDTGNCEDIEIEEIDEEIGSEIEELERIVEDFEDVNGEQVRILIQFYNLVMLSSMNLMKEIKMFMEALILIRAKERKN